MERNNIHVLARAVIVDAHHLLVCKTTDLPKNFYFLPGGHVGHGESAEETLLRELMEEVGVQGRITRFLGCLEYSFEPGHSSICHNHEYTLVFQVESENLKRTQVPPQQEPHLELVWLPLKSLSEVDFRAESLKGVLPKWLGNEDQDSFCSLMKSRETHE